MSASSCLHFTPRAELDGQQNLDAFISLCRGSPIFGANRQFQLNEWETGLSQPGKNTVVRAVFSSRDAVMAKSREPMMSEPFLSFAKAMLVYLQSQRPSTSVSVRLTALRCLEASLKEGGRGGRPTAGNAEAFDRAVELAREQLSPAAAYRTAGQLELIVSLMREKRFVQIPTPWTHGLSKPRDPGSRISAEAVAAREEKLPSAAVLAALGGVFQLAQGDVDTLVSASAALMICAPQRINELMRLERDCIITHENKNLNEFHAVSIRWPGSKGFNDHAKPMPSALVRVALEAIAKIKKVTHRAQKIARWYEVHPKEIFLHEDVEHLRGQSLISYQDVANVLWGIKGSSFSAQKWCKQAKVAALKRQNRRMPSQISFGVFEQAVISQLPPYFPYTSSKKQLLFSEALFVIQRNQLHGNRSSFECLIDMLEQADVAARLGQRNETGIPSIFARYGFTEDDGSPIVMNTHQARHYLNTLAQMSGLTQMEIALFSGRKDVGQNFVYDHIKSELAQQPVSQAIAEGRLAATQLIKSPIRHLSNRSEFKNLGAQAAHTTEYGYCVHNFASEPCQMFRDCLNCTEHVCIKGEYQKEANLRALRDETSLLLAEAQHAMNDEEFGADLWVRHQSKTLERIDDLLSVLDSPVTKLGAVVKVASIEAPAPIGHEPSSHQLRLS